MASLPARQNSQPRRSSPEQSSAPSQPQSSPSPVRTRSEDSQTVFLNKPDADTNASSEQTQAPGEQQQGQATENQHPGGRNEDNVKKCWICFSDSTEDIPETSPWRAPCPCALVAHEECLLDWIADLEAPNSRRRNQSLTGPKIECPQCKTEIKLARPRNLIVEAVRGFENAAGQLVTPSALTVLSGMVYQFSMGWGVHSIYSIFGAQDGARILRPLLYNFIRPPVEVPFARGLVYRVAAVALDHLQHWRLYVGVPMIMPVLVLARTSFADTVLPVLPILFFATQIHSSQEMLDFGAWPPSASMAFATLPYVRSAYNMYYQRVWAPKEKQWLKEIQPRVTQDAAGQDGGEQAGNNGFGQLGPREGDDNVFELRIDGWDDWEEDTDDEAAAEAQQVVDEAVRQAANRDAQAEQEEQQALPEQGADVAAAPAAEEDHRPAADQQNQQPRQQQPPQPPQQPQQQGQPQQGQQGQQQAGGERRLSFSPTAIAETVLGAMLFPSIAGLSGELLKWWLPLSWTTPSRAWGGRPIPRGLLQTKWGRSLVGGCLFVVFKDAVMLYARWKMAQMHRRRSIVEWSDRKESKSRA